MNKIYKAMGSANAKLACLRKGELKGQTLIEYALLGALLSVALVAVTIALRSQIANVFNAISNAIAGGMTTGGVA